MEPLMQPPALPMEPFAQMVEASTLSENAPPVLTTEWRRRRRRQDQEEETDDDARSVVSSQWQPDAQDVEMMHSLSLVEALPVGRMQVGAGAKAGRRVKRMKVVDLGPMGGGEGMELSGGMDLDGGLGGRGGLLGGLGGNSSQHNAGSGSGTGGAASSSAMPPPSMTDGMFTDIQLLAPADEHTGNALLCFLSPDTFVGLVELTHEGERHVLKLTGSESLTECDRSLCNVQDCCGDKAFLVTAQTCSTQTAPLARQPPPAHGAAPRRKRTYLARSSGVGDYVAFEGRGMRFLTDFVPGDEQREQVLRRHFSMLPKSARRDSVLCLGQMTLHFRNLSAPPEEPGVTTASAAAQETATAAAREEHEGYAGDKSGAESSGDEHEASVRSILPMLAGVAMPTPKAAGYSVSDLIARGGTASTEPADDDDWL
jgi:hypothetical protein